MDIGESSETRTPVRGALPSPMTRVLTSSSPRSLMLFLRTFRKFPQEYFKLNLHCPPFCLRGSLALPFYRAPQHFFDSPRYDLILTALQQPHPHNGYIAPSHE